MKKIITISILFLFGSQLLIAQKQLKFNLKSEELDIIYLNITDKNDLEYIKFKNDLDAKKSVNAKNNSINIYLQWINPLKYKLSWKDTTLTDERDKAISDFIGLLVAQFGSSVTDLNVPSAEMAKSVNATDSTEIKGVNFADKDLLLLLIHLRANQSRLSPNEIRSINSFSTLLKKLDDLDSYDILVAATKIYTSLFNYKTLKEYNDDYSNQEANFAVIESKYEQIEKLRKDISDELKALSIGDEMLKSYINAVLSAFLEKTLLNMTNNKKISSKLKPILEIVKASTKNESTNEKAKGYFKVRSVEFEDGKKLETTLTITEYEFKKETAEFSKKSDILSKTFAFQKYDIFDISVSTGIFYGNTTLKGFGVANDGNNNFTVTEDNINKNNAIAAVFLNFNFKTSRYFSPLFQIGLDPTKKRPFMLFGAGFSIPVARIALSAGPIWTWNQTLDKLTVGQTITSTTDLDKDIKYKFEVEPKGWYLGIQYNF